MKNTWGIFFALLLAVVTSTLTAQDTNTLRIGAYVDAYYNYDLNEPAGATQQYLVNSRRHNMFSINLAAVDIEYNSDRVRGRFTPGFGDYIIANYNLEFQSLKNLVNASVGVKLLKNKEVWLDAGVMEAPFSYENAFSKNQIMYSRSLAAEASPYYITGVKLSAPLSKNVSGALYVVNGWQQITDVNNQKSIIGNLEFHPDNVNINLSAIYGNETNIVNTTFRERLLVDFNMSYKAKHSPLSFAFGGYYGSQVIGDNTFEWWQANIASSLAIGKKFSLSGRVEHFNDPNAIMYIDLLPRTIDTRFQVSSLSIGGNWKISDNALLRLEGRNFISQNGDVYADSEGNPTNSSLLFWASIAVNFDKTFQWINKPSTSTN